MRLCVVVGLGYVGLPLAVALADRGPVIGYDVDQALVASLVQGHDPNGEVSREDLLQLQRVTAQPDIIVEADVIIVAVPTPIDAAKRPDVSALLAATRDVGRFLNEGTLVVFESTVYPGCTEDLCIPELERASGLQHGVHFHVAYSPERVVPGDASRSLRKVDKLVASSTEEGRTRAMDLYASILDAKVHLVESIRVAEAAKVLENVQRDLNIALMNECALIFDRAGIDTRAVIDAASTKWNFHPYRPGLVGGHCISVDPYYLTHFAELLDYHPQVIAAGRRVNDSMGRFVAQRTIRALAQARRPVAGARVGVLGLTFKEDVADLRNTRVLELVQELSTYQTAVLVTDPCADPIKVQERFRLPVQHTLDQLDAMVIAVPHATYRALSYDQVQAMFGGQDPVVLDVCGALADDVRGQIPLYWRL